MKKYWSFCLFFAIAVAGICFQTYGQNNFWTLKGKVLESGKIPLEFVNVYVNNTSIGTTTKADGSFTLEVPKTLQKVEVVVSFIGYKTLKKILSPVEMGKPLVFLLESTNLLNEVKVTAKRDKNWRKKWRIFKDGLLGESMFTSDCEILNPEVVSLEYNKDKNVVATASEPIFIQNNALGYKIMFQMDSFVSDGNLTFFAGGKFFEELKPKDERQKNRWKKYRVRAYHNSFRNFLVMLSQNKLEESGFEIFQEDKVKQIYYGRTTVSKELKDSVLFKSSAKAICSYDSLRNTYILYSKRPLLVFLTNHFTPVPIFADYPYKFSQIVLSHGNIEFSPNGWVTKPNGMILRDYWGSEGFSNLLPDDYTGENIIDYNDTPENLVNTLRPENEKKYWFVNGKISGDNGLPIEGVKVFINNSETGTLTNNEGRFTLKIPNTIQQLELVSTAPKFYTAKEILNAGENNGLVEITLKPDNVSIADENTKESSKQWKMFQKALLGDPNDLLGKTQFPESCVILNPEVVHFAYSDNKNLLATANKPLVIDNNALGYKITYQLNKFEHNFKEALISGDKFFEKLTPTDEKQELLWKKNQLKIYQESLRYFLQSLSQKKLKENGFAVFKMIKILDRYDASVTVKSQLADSSLIACTDTELCKFDPETNRFYLHSDYPLLVFLTNRTEAVRLTFKDYPYKRSQIVLPNYYLEFTADGTITNYKNAEMRDFWGNEGLSGSLPNDFVLNENNIDKLSFDAVEQLEVKSIKIDSTNKFLTNGIQFNRKPIEIAEEKSGTKLLLDYNIKINQNDTDYTIYDLLRKIPGLIVRGNPVDGGYFIGFSGAQSFKGGSLPAAFSIDNYFTDDPQIINSLLGTLNVRDVDSIGAIKYGNGAFYGARGGNGVIVITTKK